MRVTEATRLAAGAGLPGRVLAGKATVLDHGRHAGRQFPAGEGGGEPRGQGGVRLSGVDRGRGRGGPGVLHQRAQGTRRSAVAGHGPDRPPARAGLRAQAGGGGIAGGQRGCRVRQPCWAFSITTGP